jgi:hypothetical protein
MALDASPLVRRWTRHHGIVIPYYIKGRRRRYHPDIFVEYVDGMRFIEEVKGRIFNMKKFMAKNGAVLNLLMFQQGIQFRVIFEDNLEKV